MSVQEPLTRRPAPRAPAPAGRDAVAPNAAADTVEEGAALAETHPRGALLLSLCYVALLGLLWGFMYMNNVKAG